MGGVCKHCGAELTVGATACRHCDCYQDWRRFVPIIVLLVSLSGAGVLLVTMGFIDFFAPEKSFQHRLEGVSFFLTEAPTFYSRIADHSEAEVGDFSVVSYKVKLPLVVRNRSKTPVKLSLLSLSVKGGGGEKSLLQFSEYNHVGPNSSHARDLWIDLEMDKFDPELKGWKVPQIKKGRALKDDFGTAIINLYALDEHEHPVTVGSHTFEVGVITPIHLP